MGSPWSTRGPDYAFLQAYSSRVLAGQNTPPILRATALLAGFMNFMVVRQRGTEAYP